MLHLKLLTDSYGSLSFMFNIGFITSTLAEYRTDRRKDLSSKWGSAWLIRSLWLRSGAGTFLYRLKCSGFSKLAIPDILHVIIYFFILTEGNAELWNRLERPPSGRWGRRWSCACYIVSIQWQWLESIWTLYGHRNRTTANKVPQSPRRCPNHHRIDSTVIVWTIPHFYLDHIFRNFWFNIKWCCWPVTLLCDRSSSF